MKIVFGNGEGVCNGGHTYLSIVTTQYVTDPSALVHLEFIELPADLIGPNRTNVIKDIATMRNSNTKLALKSQADFQGYYDVFKRSLLDATWVSWHEGDSAAKPNAIGSDHFIRLLAALDPVWYYHPIFNRRAKIHKSAATAVQSIHWRWYQAMEGAEEEELNLVHMAPLANDLLRIRDMISRSLRHDTFAHGIKNSNFYQDWILPEGEADLLTQEGKGLKFPGTLDVLFVGLFRTDVWLGLAPEGTVRYSGWYVDPEVLWEKRKNDVLGSLVAAFQDFGHEPLQFIRAQTPYSNDMFRFGTLDADAPLPSTLFAVEDGRRFVQDDEAFTHWLDTSNEIELKPRTDTPLNDAVKFREVPLGMGAADAD